MRHYTAAATREGKWWLVRIPALNGLTQARRLADAELMAREHIAVTLDVPIEDVSVDVEVKRIGDVDVPSRLARIRNERERAAELERAALHDAAELAKDLAAAQVPLRDIGAAMGISFQRVHQLIHS